LAEGQKSTESSTFVSPTPPSACQMELAEWVIFPEKNPRFGSQPLSFGGGGQPATPDQWFACASTRACYPRLGLERRQSACKCLCQLFQRLAKFSDLLMTCQLTSYVKLPVTLPLCHALGNDAIVAKPGQPRSAQARGGKKARKHGAPHATIVNLQGAKTARTSSVFRSYPIERNGNQQQIRREKVQSLTVSRRMARCGLCQWWKRVWHKPPRTS